MRVLLKETGPYINVRTLFFRNPHLLTNHNSLVTKPKAYSLVTGITLGISR